jgi:hypothetical protein
VTKEITEKPTVVEQPPKEDQKPPSDPMLFTLPVLLSMRKEELAELVLRLQMGSGGQPESKVVFSKDVLAKMKKEAWERADKSQMDVGSILLGETRLRIPVIPGKLEPTFRMLSPQHHAKVSSTLPPENDPNWMRLMSAYVIASALVALNGKEMVDVLQAKQPDEAIKVNAERVMALPDAAYTLVWAAYDWFVEWCNSAVSTEALGNG